MTGRVFYEHTQRGWTIVVALVLIPAPIVAVLTLSGLPLVGLALGVFLLGMVLLFHSLTVVVSDEVVIARFGVGLIRKAIPLERIRSYRVVQNSFWYGFGIRFTPHGMLWNVSGLEAVELLLEDGKRFRIGSDEPEALAGALRSALGDARPFSEEVEAVTVGRRRRYWLIVLGAILVVPGGVGLLLWAESRPPKASVDETGLHVSSAVYSVDVPLTEITSVSLEKRLPRIVSRTNGTALGKTLRGHFQVKRLGKGRLFLEYGHPPYLLVRTRDDFVIVGYEDGERTLALYEQLAAWR